MTSALDRVRAAREMLGIAEIHQVDAELAQAEADLAREEKTGGQSGTTAAVPAQAPEPIDPGSTPGTGNPRPDGVAALVTREREIERLNAGSELTGPWLLLKQLADALEAGQRKPTSVYPKDLRGDDIIAFAAQAFANEGYYREEEAILALAARCKSLESMPAFTEAELRLVRQSANADGVEEENRESYRTIARKIAEWIPGARSACW